MANKFNIGDYVEVVAVYGDSLPVGSRGTIVEMDDDFGGWMYGLDSDNETFYNEHMLEIVDKPADNPNENDVSEPDKVEENHMSHDYRIIYYVDQRRVVIVDGNDKVVVDDNKRSVEVQNVFITGFFEGLKRENVHYKVSVQYVSG